MSWVEDARGTVSARVGEAEGLDDLGQWDDWLRNGVKSFTDFLNWLAQMMTGSALGLPLLWPLLSPINGQAFGNVRDYEAHLYGLLRQVWIIDWSRFWDEVGQQ